MSRIQYQNTMQYESCSPTAMTLEMELEDFEIGNSIIF